MDINNDLLSRILGGDSSSKVHIINWHIENNIIKSGYSHTSQLSRLIVEYQRKSKTLKKSFILKIPSSHPTYEMGLKYDMYSREYPIYTTVLEEMYKIDGEYIGPRLYYAGPKHSLMLKDLSMSGYKMADRVQQLDYQQCNMVFQSLAKFHALSVKLNQQQPSLKLSSRYNQSRWFTQSKTFDHFHQFMQVICTRFEEVFDFKSKKLKNILADFKNRDYLETLFRKISSLDNFEFNVLIHGDCWTGNVLFKSDKYGNVKKVKLIDFQQCVWTSPANDILYFTITSMQFDVFQKHFDLLMEMYVETLNNILRYFDCPGPYTVEDLRRDINNSVLYSVFVIVMLLPRQISSHESPLDFIDGLVKGETLDLVRYNKIYENEIYKDLVEKWISYYQETGT